MGFHGKVALFAAACAGVAVLASSRHLVSSITTPAARPPEPADAGQQRQQQYAAAIDAHTRQVDGRSLFFVPSAPPPPPPPPPTKVDSGPPPPPPPPARYGGPSIIAMLNDTVWFEGGDRLGVGESSDAVKVVRLNAPWSAVVEWKGVEFTVDLFKKDAVVAPEPSAPEPAGPASAAGESASRLSATDPVSPPASPAVADKE